jgi:hypothetical protein
MSNPAHEVMAFPTAAVLSAATGVLVCPISDVYAVLNWMTGEDVYTHQLPRVSREAQPVILALHPELSEAYAEAKEVTPANWPEWLGRWLLRYGETITVPRLTEDQHERIDPHSELAEKMHPDRIVVVDPKDFGR